MVWDVARAAGGESVSIGKQWAHGRDPTKNMVANIRVLACEDTWQAKIQMYGEAAAHWFYSVFIPSRFEVFRKTITGSYKCGFYFGTKWKSPIDLIPGATGQGLNIYGKPFLTVSETFAEIVRPVVTGLFYLWAIGSAYEALATWQSLIYASEMCGLVHEECLLADGYGEFFNTGGSGEPNFYVVLYDPNGWHPAFSSFVSVPEPKYVTADAVWEFTACGNGCSNVDIYLHGIGAYEGSAGTVVHLGAVAGGSFHTGSLEFAGLLSPTNVSVAANVSQSAAPLDKSVLRVRRLTVTERDVPKQNQCIIWEPRGHAAPVNSV